MCAFKVVCEGVSSSLVAPSSSPMKSPHLAGVKGAKPRQVPTLLTPLKCQRPIPYRQTVPGHAHTHSHAHVNTQYATVTSASTPPKLCYPLQLLAAMKPGSPLPMFKQPTWFGAGVPVSKSGEAGGYIHQPDYRTPPRMPALKRSNRSRSDDSTGSSHSTTARPKPKRFECGQCTMKFSRKDHLRRHKLIHSGVRPFECEQCKQKFARKDHLKRHYRRHLPSRGERCTPILQSVNVITSRLASFTS